MKKDQSPNLSRFVPVIGVFVLVLGGISLLKRPPTTSSTPADSATPVAQKVIELEAGSFYYKPSEITLKKGENVKIVLRSVSMMHDFNIDELGIHSLIVKDGDTGTVEFTPTQVGTFEYYCSVGQHRQNGQIGKLTVQE